MSKYSDAIKKLNARLATFEKRGLTGTWEYRALRKKIATAIGDDLTISPQGYTRISGKGRSSIARKSLISASRSTLTATAASRRLERSWTQRKMAAFELGLLGFTSEEAEERRKAYEKTLKKVTSSLKKAEQSEFEDRVHSFIETHKADIYEVEYFNDMIRSGKPLTDEDVQELLNMYSSDRWIAHAQQTEIEQRMKNKELSGAAQYTLDMLDAKRALASSLEGAGKDTTSVMKEILEYQKELKGLL